MAARVFSRAALRELRTQTGLTRRKLQERSGIAEDSITKLEYGYRRDPRASTVALLADALGCQIDDLFRAAP